MPSGNTGVALSVIVPTTGSRRSILGRCLAALGAQTLERTRFEVIVVPNGPLRSGYDPITGADKVLRVDRLGAAGARNTGAQEASGEFVLFLDDDILADPDCLAMHLDRQGKHRGAIFGPAYPVGAQQTLAEQVSSRWWLDHYSRKHTPGHRFSFVDCLTGNMSIPRDTFNDLGGLDRSFDGHRREDWEFGFRLIEAGIPMVAAPEAIAYHHHARSVTLMLRDAMREGYGDVLLTLRHSGAVRDLRIAEATPDVIHGLRWRLDVLRGRAVTSYAAPAAEAMLASLERMGRRVRWAEKLGRLIVASYRAGVQAALDAGHSLSSQPFLRTLVDLDSDEPIVTGPAFGELTFRLRGLELGHVLAPDGQWDADRIVERAVQALGMPALAALAEGAHR